MPYVYLGGPLDGEVSKTLHSDYTPVTPPWKFAHVQPHPMIRQMAVWNRTRITKARYWVHDQHIEATVGEQLRVVGTRDRGGLEKRSTHEFPQKVTSITPGELTLEGSGDWEPRQYLVDLEVLAWEDESE